MFLTAQETTLAAAAIAALAALAGAYLTGRRDDRKARREREHHAALERERWKREDRSAWAEKRFEAHTAFARASLDALRYCESGGQYAPELEGSPRDPESAAPLVLRTRSLVDALVLLELRASEPVRNAAEEAADSLRRAAANAYVVAARQASPEQVESWKELAKDARAARDAYLKLAQEELGTA
jgi:hypothetical protein